MKRTISLILAMIMMFAIFTINASATSSIDNIYNGADSTSIRVTGDNRYITSINTANMLKKALNTNKFSTIIVAYGRNYADALAGSYLAALTKAPILLVNTDKNNQNDKSSMELVREYIDENLTKNGTVYVLGGKAVISESFVKSLNEYGRTVKRLAGNNRYETNIKILKECINYEGDPGVVLVCDAYNYADSLSVSSLGAPILLIDKQSGKLTNEQIEYLKNRDFYIAAVIGGTAAVPESIEKSVEKYCDVFRISGKNRYDTSKKIAETFYENQEIVVLAYGHDFPDGLCGGPLAYTIEAPVLLVYNDSGKEGTNLYYAKEYINNNNITYNITLGGLNAVTKKTVKTLKDREKFDMSSWTGLYSSDSGNTKLFLWKIEDNKAYFHVFTSAGVDMGYKEAESYLLVKPIENNTIHFTCEDSWVNNIEGTLSFYKEDGIKKVHYEAVKTDGLGNYGIASSGVELSYVKSLSTADMTDSIMYSDALSDSFEY